jgi:hypothetical protein
MDKGGPLNKGMPLDKETSLEIFVIFHKRIFPEMYEELDDDERSCLRFIAVNENFEKDICPESYIKEWEGKFVVAIPELIIF